MIATIIARWSRSRSSSMAQSSRGRGGATSCRLCVTSSNGAPGNLLSRTDGLLWRRGQAVVGGGSAGNVSLGTEGMTPKNTKGLPLSGRAPHVLLFRPGSPRPVPPGYAAFGFLPGAGAGTYPDTRHCHASVVLVPS